MLDLGPSRSSPRLVAGIVLLGAVVPCEQVPAVLAFFTAVTVTAETVRRLTEAAGAAAVALEEAAVARIERDLPDGPGGPAVHLLSVDGAMVPLVGGQWAAGTTLAVGTIVPGSPAEDGSPAVRTAERSSFSRLAAADAFGRLATVETHRRGRPSAGTVWGVTDGAAWCQGVLDLQRPDAVRLVDVPHAAGSLSQAAQARSSNDPLRARTWLSEQTRTLRRGDPAAVLAALDAAGRALDPAGAAAPVVRAARA